VTLEAVERVLAAGGRLSLDPNLRREAPRAGVAFDEIDALLEDAAVVFPNEAEASTLGVRLDGAAARGAVICVTRGANGAQVTHDGVVTELDGDPVREVDPTGAGDTFAGVFLAVYAASGDVAEAASAANAAGAAHVAAEGPMERAGWPLERAER
jgi:sugar/nucleoside kinase (ribokinase family)